MTPSQPPEASIQAPKPSPEGRPDTSTENLGRKAATAVAWNGVQLWGYNIVSLGVFVVLGRILSPRDFGLAAAAIVVIWFLRIIVDAGFSNLLVQRPHFDSVFADTSFWTACLLGLLFTAVTVAAAPAFALLFGEPRITGLIRALSLIFIFVAIDSTPTALFQRELKWRALALRRLGAAGASAAVAIWLAMAGAGAWALVAQQLVLEGLTMSLLWFATTWRPSFHFSGSAFRELAAFGGRYSALRVLGYLGGNVDNFLIGIFLGPVALGYYVIAYRIFTVLNELFVQTINNVTLTTFSRLQHDKGALNAMFSRASASAALIAFPAYAALAVAAGQLIPAVFGSRWHASVPVLELLTIAGAAQAQLAFTSSYVIAIGLIKREVPWTIAVTFAELLGFAVTVHFGIVAVAAALAGVLTIAWPVRLLFLRAWGGLSLASYARSILPSVIAAAVIVALILPLHLFAPLPTAALLVSELALAALVYPLLLVLLVPSELRQLRLLLRQARTKSRSDPV